MNDLDAIRQRFKKVPAEEVKRDVEGEVGKREQPASSQVATANDGAAATQD